jgi:hypothetical protein
MPNSYKLEFTVGVPMKPLLDSVTKVQSIGTLKAELFQPEEGRILFINPSTWSKRGQNVLVFFREKGADNTLVIVHSSCISALQLFDGGQNQKNCETVREHILGLAKKIVPE